MKEKFLLSKLSYRHTQLLIFIQKRLYVRESIRGISIPQLAEIPTLFSCLLEIIEIRIREIILLN